MPVKSYLDTYTGDWKQLNAAGEEVDFDQDAAATAIWAKKKLLAGTASATNTMPHLGFIRLLKLTGTGFAKPNINRPPEPKSSNAGNKIVPKGSICLKGLKGTRPRRLAVSSPSFKAAHP